MIFARSLVPLARRAQRSLEAETLQKDGYYCVDLVKIVFGQNELSKFELFKKKDEKSMLASTHAFFRTSCLSARITL